MTFLNQTKHFSFAHYGVVQIQSCKFNLLGMMDAEVFTEPVIKRAMVFKFQSTKGMSDALDGIRLTMCEIIGRINFPNASSLRMFLIKDTIKYWVTKIQIWGAHVYLRPQGSGTFSKSSLFHLLKKIEVFFYGSVTERTFLARFDQIPAQFTHLLKAEVTNKSFMILDQLNRPIMELPEIVGGMK